MRVAVLAVQGAFIEHEQMLAALGVDCLELRQRADLLRSFDALVLPGGESTVQGKLLRELELLDELRQRIRAGLPVLATCAGLILLAEQISNDSRSYLATLPCVVRRNAYGRQLGSFVTRAQFGTLGELPMTFIRAPYIESVSGDTQVLARVEGKIVAAQSGRQLGLAFHPELGADTRIHEYFLRLAAAESSLFS